MAGLGSIYNPSGAAGGGAAGLYNPNRTPGMTQPKPKPKGPKGPSAYGLTPQNPNAAALAPNSAQAQANPLQMLGNAIQHAKAQRDAVGKAKVKPVRSTSDPRFIAAANAGAFGPVTLQQLLDSPEYKQAGNNTQAYDQQYQQAMAASRANITQMYGAALSEINQRQGAGDQAIAALPGQISAAYAPAKAAVDQNAQAAYDAQKASGLSTYMPASAISAPTDAAMATSEAAHQADVPVLHQAINTELGSERTKVQMQQSQALSDLDQKEADHAQSQIDNGPSWMQKLLINDWQQTQQAKASGDAKAAKDADTQHQQMVTALAQMKPGVDPHNAQVAAKSKVLAPEIAAIKSGQKGRSSKAYNEGYAAFNALVQKHQNDTDGGEKGKAEYNKKKAELMKKYPNQSLALSAAALDAGA